MKKEPAQRSSMGVRFGGDLGNKKGKAGSKTRPQAASPKAGPKPPPCHPSAKRPFSLFMVVGILGPLLAIIWFFNSGSNPASNSSIHALFSSDSNPNSKLAPAVISGEGFVPGSVPGAPPWAWTERYNGTWTQSGLEAALHIFDLDHALASRSTFDENGYTLYTDATRQVSAFHLSLAAPGTPVKPAPLDYRPPATFRALPKPEGKPLAGLRLAIDPGHIGGAWGQIEDRSITYPGVGRLQEGDLNLITARLLTKQLTDWGAEVFVTRQDATPVTSFRPENLEAEALEALLQWRPEWNSIPVERRPQVLRSHIELMSHLLFERKYEFLARGAKIRLFKPDLTVVLYINATPSSGRGHLIGDNRNIFFIEGAYLPEELAQPDQQQRLFYKMFDHVTPVEYEVAAHIAQAFTKTTGLRPVEYGNSPTTRLIDPDNFYVVARNLGANRQYDGPVVTTEPYFMNNRIAAQRLVAGDYDGEMLFGGQAYRSIFREYADNVAQGILESYGPSSASVPAAVAEENPKTALP